MKSSELISFFVAPLAILGIAYIFKENMFRDIAVNYCKCAINEFVEEKTRIH